MTATPTGNGGSGGGAGGSGGAVVPRYADTFDTDKEMWPLSDYVDANYKNLGAAAAPDSGVSLDGGMAPTLDVVRRLRRSLARDASG